MPVFLLQPRHETISSLKWRSTRKYSRVLVGAASREHAQELAAFELSTRPCDDHRQLRESSPWFDDALVLVDEIAGADQADSVGILARDDEFGRLNSFVP